MSRAKYLLENFPGLWAKAQGEVEDIIEGCGHRELSGIQGAGGHSDPTGNRAARLAEAHDLTIILEKVRQWIDKELPPGDRPLLLAVWRYPFGWYWIARELHRGVPECRNNWIHLCSKLEDFLSR